MHVPTSRIGAAGGGGVESLGVAVPAGLACGAHGCQELSRAARVQEFSCNSFPINSCTSFKDWSMK